MTQSIMSLHPTLQTVWTAAYQASIQGQYTWQANPQFGDMGPIDGLAREAERHAWEAVRCANGGVDPVVTAPSPSPTPTIDVNAILADVGGTTGVAKRLVELGYALERPACPNGRMRADLEAEIDSLRYAARNSWRDLSDLLGIVCGPGFVALSTEEDVIDALAPVVASIMWDGSEDTTDDHHADEQTLAHARTALRNPDAPSLADTDALIARVALAAAKALNRGSVAPTAPRST